MPDTVMLPPGDTGRELFAFKRRIIFATRYMWIWAIPALLGIDLKRAMMNGDGYLIVARSLGRIEPRQSLTDSNFAILFNFFERLSFFRGELFWGFIVFPAIAVVIVMTASRRLRAPVITLSSIMLVVLLYVEKRTWFVVGRFLSYALAQDAFRFGIENLNTAGEYFSLASLVKLGILLVVIIAIAWWVRRGEYLERAVKSSPGGLVTSVLWVVLAGVAIISWYPWMTPTKYHGSVYASFAEDLVVDRATQSGRLSRLTQAELLQEYRKLVNAPEPLPAPAHWGQARDCDLILIVLETCPARCLPLDADLPDFPTLSWLRQRAWVATRHYTTFPYTSRAIFSLLTSWYPPILKKNVESQLGHSAIPGLVGSLKSAGYVTALYAPDKFTREESEEVYKRLGVEHQFYSESTPLENGSGAAGLRPWEKKERLDGAALRALRNDMMGWHRANKRFAAIFLPQLGHAPWPDIVKGGQVTEVIARGRAVMARQDRMFAEIVEQLKRAGRLEKTLIVVTGDHGVRTRAEDPALPAGVIDEYSFKVPLLIFAPMATTSRQDVPWLTSHIDLMPSLLDLLGISGGRDLEQGAPLWDKRLATRTSFFFANFYMGSDGFHEQGQFFMRNYVNDAVYAGNRLGFDDKNLLRYNDPIRNVIVRRLAEMTELQESWVRRFTGGADGH
jgi:arylsulfatase A-like enzyme